MDTIPQIHQYGWRKVKYNIESWRNEIESIIGDNLYDGRPFSIYYKRKDIRDEMIKALFDLVALLEELAIHHLHTLKADVLKKIYTYCGYLKEKYSESDDFGIQYVIQKTLPDLMTNVSVCFEQEVKLIEKNNKYNCIFRLFCNDVEGIVEDIPAPLPRLL